MDVEAVSDISDLTSCSCKGGCDTKACKCKKSNLRCSNACSCKNCSNKISDGVDDDSDSDSDDGDNNSAGAVEDFFDDNVDDFDNEEDSIDFNIIF